MPSTSNATLQDLAAALRRRLEVIGDQVLREADPAAHLQQLKEAAEEIWRLQASLGETLPPQLAHFLESQSYQKALALAEFLLVRADAS